ncbi:hypothetical protein UPYG_G00300200 [Umbra pygmaea]|uniref:RGS domain-containing protein n=1 Tax=Umbra pygmaea TaxID=75934 RepID=A0ABD0WR86_UMBPY
MPVLVAVPSELQDRENMDMEDENRKQSKGYNMRLRIQRSASHTCSTERLGPGEMLQWSQSLSRLLSSKYGISTFQAFLKSEFSDENIEFWQVCEDFKKMRLKFVLNSRAKKIFNTYIEAHAPKEINIDHKTRELIRRNMKTPKAFCFDEAQRIVYSLMEKDSYPRFLRSSIYRNLLDASSQYMN